MTQHTPTPWVDKNAETPETGNTDIQAADGTHIISACGCCDGAHVKLNDRKFIIRACNAHEELVAALEWAKPYVARLRDTEIIDAALTKARL